MKRYLFISLLLICSDSLAQTKISAPDTSISIRLNSVWRINSGGSLREKNYPEGKGTLTVKLDNSLDQHMAYLHKDGYVTEGHVLSKDRGYATVYNLPFRYVKEVVHTNKMTRLYVDSINCPEGKMDIYLFNYEKHSQYLKNKPKTKEQFYNTSIKEINFLNAKYRLEEGVNYSLALKGFIDTNETKLFEAKNNYKKLVGIMRKMRYHNGIPTDMMASEVEWQLIDPYSNKLLISKIITDSTSWISNNTKLEVFNEALSNSLNLFLQHPDVTPHLKDVKTTSSELLASWNQMSIDTNASRFGNINSLLSSIITIKTPDGHGSGCVISKTGLALTNYHVCGLDSKKSYVIFSNGDTCHFKILRYNPYFDLALIQLTRKNTPSLRISTNKNILIGSDVFAIGTPSDVNLNQSVTKGIISSVRTHEDLEYIQSDVKVSPGNSGGALIDSNYELIGIVNSKIIGRGIEGLSFSIPVFNIEKALNVKFD